MPGPEAAGQVGRSRQSEILESSCRKARRVALRADDDDPDVVPAGFGNPRRGRRVEPPLKYVALQDSRAGDHAFSAALLGRTDVDQECSRLVLVCRLLRVDSNQPRAGGFEQLIDRHSSPSPALEVTS